MQKSLTLILLRLALCSMLYVADRNTDNRYGTVTDTVTGGCRR